MVGIDKNIMRSSLIIFYIIIISMLLFLISSLYSYLNTGADRSKILHTELKDIRNYIPKITWVKDGNEGRIMDTQTLTEIEKDYLDGWYVKHIAYKSNLTTGINDYYTKNARKNIQNIIKYNDSLNITIDATTLKHNPDIVFFSEDGQLAVLEDKNVLEYKRIIKNKYNIYETTEFSNYKAILLLEDGFWRIRHLVKEGSSSFQEDLKKTNLEYTNIKGINYYPQATPWSMFGDNFELKIIEEDFNIIKRANLNTIRIFVPYDDFGKENVDENKLKKLNLLLNLADKKGIKVIVTLFDFYGNYDVLDWTFTFKHAEKIVSKFKNHNAILAWDLKNEPNLDFKSRGKENVIPWLEHLLYLVKSIDTKHPVTIGWSNTESAHLLSDKLDFISFHYYDNLEMFEKKYKKLKSNLPNKPIVLGEFGMSSYSGIWNFFEGSEKKQAEYFKNMQHILTTNNIPFLSWTLYDFSKIPKGVVGKRPWRVNPQKKFGFIKNNGEKKPSFKYISKQ